MGGSSSRVTLKANQPSPSDSSKRSVVSDPLEGLDFEDEAFWKHFGELKRQETYLPTWAKLLGVHIAKHEVTDLDDGSFLVKDVIGGYYGTEVEVNYKHSYDPATNTWTQTSDRDPQLQKVTVNVYLKLHSQPRIIELWCLNETAKNGGLPVQAAMKGTLGHILKELNISDEGLDVKADQPSLDGSGTLVAQTGPLDSFLSPELFFENLAKMIRDGKGSEFVVSVDITELPSGDGFDAEEHVNAEAGEATVHARHSYDKTKDEFRSAYFEDVERKEELYAFVTQAFRNPFRLELVIESYPKRHAGEDVVKSLQPQIEHVLEKALAEPKADS